MREGAIQQYMLNGFSWPFANRAAPVINGCGVNILRVGIAFQAIFHNKYFSLCWSFKLHGLSQSAGIKGAGLKAELRIRPSWAQI